VSTLALICNPHSGRGPAVHDPVCARAEAAGIPVARTHSAAEVPGILRAFAGDGVDTLAVAGGDATVDSVITAMRTHRAFTREPGVIALRGGTTNMTHADVGMSGPPERALRRVLAARDAGRPLASRWRAPIVLDHDTGARRYGFFFATAAVPRAIDRTVTRVYRRGLPGPLANTAMTLLSLARLTAGDIRRDPILHPDAVRWALDSEAPRAADTVVLMTTTLHRVLLGARTRPETAGLRVSGITWPARARWCLPGFLAGWAPADPAAGRWRAAAARLAVQTRAACTLDGEVLDGDPDGWWRLRVDRPVDFRVAQGMMRSA